MSIDEIAARLRTQDNRATHLPIFVVEQKRRVYGFDTGYADDADIAWIDPDGEPGDADEVAEIEAKYQDTGEEPEGWTRTAFQDRWEFVTACFTEQGCKDFLAVNKHNLTEPRIYVYSGYRNREWEEVRDHLLGVPHV